MSRRYTSTGSEYVCRADPGRVRTDGARFERPAGELPLWLGVLVLAAGIGLIVGVVLMIGEIL